MTADRQTDDHLKALFAQDLPPARDAAFSAAVTERLVRRRWLQDLAFLGGISVIGAIALWALWPVLHPAVTAVSEELAPAAWALALAFAAVAILGGFGDRAQATES